MCVRGFCFVFFALACIALYAQTDIEAGSISGHWDTSGSPYLVHGTITIDNGSALTIAPGVVICFDPGSSLAVYGCLSARGTVSDSIRFSSATNWNGIFLSGTDWSNDSTRIEYCNITRSQNCGVYFDSAARVAVRNCRIHHNTGDWGAGIYVYGCTPTITDNLIDHNYASTQGGGLCVYFNSSPIIARNRFISNTAEMYGGGLCILDCIPMIYDNGFIGNQALQGGGSFLHNSSAQFANCRFYNNTATQGGGVNCGSGCVPYYFNCLFANNYGGFGGAFTCDVCSNPWLENCTVVNNEAIYGGGYFCYGNTEVTTFNTILWGNRGSGDADQVHLNIDADPYFDHCLIESGLDGFDGGGITNYDTSHCQFITDGDPRFIYPSTIIGPCSDALATDWSLHPSSPAINSGYLRPDNFLPDTDLAGNPRIVGAEIDLGAYEYPIVANNDDTILPTKLTLTNSPNPFNPETTIRYSLPQGSTVRLSVYDIRGQRVKTLVDAMQTAGDHAVRWNGTNDAGTTVASGMYFYRLQAGSVSVTHKCMLLK